MRSLAVRPISPAPSETSTTIRAPVYGWPSKYSSACSSPEPMSVSASPRPTLPAAIAAVTTSW